jgi:hypothetical protein
LYEALMLTFPIGQVAGAVLIGAVGGLFVNASSIVSFAIAMGVAAAAAVFICKIWPGWGGPGWQLWFVGAFANPLMLVAMFFAADAADCVIGKAKGPACLFGDIGPLVAGVCLLPPLIGVGLRWLLRPRPVPQPPV